MATSNPNDSTPAGRTYTIDEMRAVCKKIRRDIITMISTAGSGHPGGSLSAVEILVALYFSVLKHNPADPHWVDRDRFILSKGHAAPALYSTLCESGYLREEELCTLRQIDSRLQGHPECNLTPGVEMSAGALGQGLSFGIGLALSERLDSKNYYTYVLMGDGECDEGQVWEAAMAAAQFKVDRLIAIIDNNGLQIDGWNKYVMNLEPFPEKWRSFNWNVIEASGNDVQAMIEAFKKAKQFHNGKPTVIIAHTVKGEGVSFMENNADFHGKAPNAAELKKALSELE